MGSNNERITDVVTKQSVEILIKELGSGVFPEDRMPNTEEEFSGEKEFRDYQQFQKLLGSKFYTSVLNVQTDEYIEDILSVQRSFAS